MSKHKVLWGLTILAIVVALSPAPATFAAAGSPQTPAVAVPAFAASGATCQVLQPGPAVALDAYIKQEKPDERQGGSNELKVKTENGKLIRSLLQFDLSFVPAGATISSATLSLWVKEVRDGNATISAHQVTASWNEAEVTWKARDKAAALLWTNEGADYNATALSTHNVVKDVKNYWATWNVTAAASAWVATPANNFGLLLESPVTSPRNETKFKSSEDGTTTQRPKLEVCYTSGAVSIAPNNSGQGIAGQTKTYAHTVTVGSVATTVSLITSSSRGWATRVYRDDNGNGQVDAGEPQISQLVMGANTSQAILAQVDIPNTVTLGTVDYTTVKATALANGSSATATDTTRAGNLISVIPNGGTYATAGTSVFYSHTVINNGATTDQITVSATSSRGWLVLLWEDTWVSTGRYETPLTNPLVLGPGQSHPIVVEVRVPAGATTGTVDRTSVRAASSNIPGVAGLAVDTTEVFVNDPPVIDGKYDSIYQISPYSEEVCYVLNGQVFGRLASFFQPSGNYVYAVLAIDRSFVDNTYGANAAADWPSGHTFDNLDGSDKAEFFGFDANGVQVFNVDVDYIDAKAGTPSGFASLGVNGAEGKINSATYATVASFPDWGTSLEYSLNETGYCSGGNCSAGGTNLLADSPATDEFYTPNPTYPDWIFDVIYELKIDKAAFGPAGYGYMEVPYIHASPSKLGTNTLVPDVVPCTSRIGDTVWHDLNHDGVQDPGEPGIDGVQVKLYSDSNGDGILETSADTVVGTQSTTGGGHYLFQLLPPGDYFVDVVDSTVPAGYVITTYNDPTPVISLAEGADYLQADFGYTEAYGELEILKTLSTPPPLYVGQEVAFNIRVRNIGNTIVNQIPLEDYYDPSVLEFISATPATVDSVSDGILNWADLTASFNHDLAPGEYFDVTVRFKALQATSDAMGRASALAVDAEPVVDGMLDSDYTYVGQLSASGAGGPLYTYKGASMCYYAFMLDRRYNSNVYADNDPAYMALASQTSTRHKFGDLLGSDNAIFNISSPGGNYTNLGLDLLNGAAGAWSSGQTGKDGSKLPGATVIADAMTSLHWNLENSGWTNLTHSPALNYNQASGQYWEWSLIYEFSIPLSKLGNQCGTVTLVSAHTSPAVYSSSLATIGDRVWADANENTLQDAGEVGLPGVVVNLYQGATLVRTTETAPGSSGYYIFANLAAGTYTVNVDETTVPPDWVLTTANEPATVTVTAGQNYTTADFGYWESGRGSIGDLVFYDLDGNGSHDAGEPGIGGVTMNLYNGVCVGGFLKKTMTTASDGSYDFTSLPAGAYCVEVDDASLPEGYTLTTGNEPMTVQLADDEDFNDADFGYRVSCPEGTPNLATTKNAVDATGTVLPDVASYACVDFGSNPGAIGDFVWYDANEDGIQDIGEPGIANVTLDLYRNGVKLQSTVTDADGGYLFRGLPPGDYSVAVTDLNHKLTGYTLSVGNQSQPNPTPIITLLAGDVYKDADFGYYKPPADGKAIIGDTVWFDDNGDGFQQPSEPGIPNITIVVLKNGATVATAQTDSNGHYLVEVLAGDGYTVSPVAATIPSGLFATTPVPAAVPPLKAGDQYLEADFGYDDRGWNLLGEIGNLVWLDSSQNGIFDGAETALAGVSVDLIRETTVNGVWDAGEPIIATVTTGGDLDLDNGNYLFTGLPVGSYLVHVSDTNAVLLDYTASPEGDPNADGTSKHDPYPVSLATPGAINLKADFGFHPQPSLDTGVIGNQVWVESVPNGVFDPLQGDFGQPGVTVELLKDGFSYATTTTGASGDYSFVHLPAGNYQVQVLDDYGVLTGYPVTVLGPNPGQDNNNQAQPYSVILAAGGYNLTADFGYYKPPVYGAIGDFVFYDANHDGIQDVGEPGIANVRLDLYLSMDGNNQINPGVDQLVAATVSDADGGYLFPKLKPGVYFVDVKDAANPNGTLNGLVHTLGFQSASDATPPISLSAGGVYKDADFGYYQVPGGGKAIVGDTVWYDDNGDGIQQPGEPGIPGVTVVITDSAGTRIGLAVTDALGHYRIEVAPGSGYTAGIDAAASSTVLAGLMPTTPQPLGLPPLSPGQQYLEADFGYDDTGVNLLGEIGNSIWNDADMDGILDNGELPLGGVSVDLIRDVKADGIWDLDGVDNVLGTADDEPIIATVTSNTYWGSGNYLFTGLVIGSYLVHVSDTNGVLLDFTKTIAVDQVSDGTSKYDPYPATLVGPGYEELRADFGYYQNPGENVGVIGNQVWIETLGENSPLDGLYDLLQGDFGQAGVTVALLQGGQVIRTTTTGASGDYSFVHLPAGAYQVQVTDAYSVLADYSPTTPGPNPTQDDNNQTQPYGVNLPAGGYNLTADFGYSVVGGQSTASYVITKRLNTPEPVRVGREVSFTIAILNTSTTAWLAYLPLQDVYSTTYLSYLYASPATVNNVNDGVLDWQDMTKTFGAIEPGRTVTITVWFRGIKDTWMLPDGRTTNEVTAYDVWADPDGPTGPEWADLPLPDKGSLAKVQLILPTGVALADFGAAPAAEGVVLTWETTNEANIAGFRVLRQTSDGGFAAVTEEMIFAEHAGGNQGASYSFTDLAAGSGDYVYVLEIVKLDGSTEQSEPVQVQR